MKIGISNIAWNKNDEKEILKFLSDTQIFNIEIAPTKITENPYSNSDFIKKYYKNYDERFMIFSMQSICFGITYNLFKSLEEKNFLLQHLKKVIEFASKLEIPNIVFGCPKNRNIENFDNSSYALSFFRELDNFLESKNTIIALEPNPTIYGTNFLNTTKEVVEFIRSNNFKNIKINFDLGSFIYNKENISDLKNYADLINHVHISIPNLEPIIDFNTVTELLLELKKLNYNKGVSIEMKETTKENVLNVLKKVKQSYETL